MREEYLAHTFNKAKKVDFLRTHVRDVANRMAEYAAAFDASTEAFLTGLLHDLGKYGELFQRRLEGKERGIDHWSLGGWAALTIYKHLGIASALAIQGHHIGLQQASKDSLVLLNPKKLEKKHPLSLRLSEADMGKLLHLLNVDGVTLPSPDELGQSLYGGLQALSAAGMFDVRMLFSALVDADFIETEAHFRPEMDGNKRYRVPGPLLKPERDFGFLETFLEDLVKQSKASDHVTRMRSDLLNACLEAASSQPGLFTLTAPTGAGKTLSMLAFALKHAKENELRRIVMVIPYLSIIDQTVQEYRKVLASCFTEADIEHYILEHHSLAGTGAENIREGAEAGMESEARRQTNLLAENWDAPIIITTSVQFLESLFSNRPSACRKLHRLARSIVLFDEVQTLPAGIVIPTLATLSRLAERYGSTVVFSTATQPAFSHLDTHVKKFCAAGWNPDEIVPASLRLYEKGRRIRVTWPQELDTPTPWTELADRIASRDDGRALCIVNLKRHALILHDELKRRGVAGLFHLSTNMCPAHRRVVLEEVRERLEQGKPCRLISTQCVEAGVDVDFPVVFRAWGPLDAIAQAAGRCNRHGLRESGEVVVFMPEEKKYPLGAYGQAADVTSILFKTRGADKMDIYNPELFSQYYRYLYDLIKPENKNEKLLKAIELLDFSEAAKLYRVMPKNTINVLVPYAPELFQELKGEVFKNGLTREWVANARPHSIGLYAPRPGDAVTSYLDSVPITRGESSDDWFVYREQKHYNLRTGLEVPESPGCIIA